MPEPVLIVKNLKKLFFQKGNAPPLVAVDNVSFELLPGECLGVIGESGSGKSTLANMITLLIDPDSGKIFLNGEDVTKSRNFKKIYNVIQMVFQDPAGSFDPRRTLGDAIGEPLENHGVPSSEIKIKVGRFLALCGLPPKFSSKYPHEVSGGECQRAAIARAIAIKPKVLICDEATSALDVTVQSEIIDLLTRLIRDLNMACLFICHDIALVQHFCHRVIVMNRGRIVEEGTPDEVIRSPKEDYTKMLISSVL